jgi:predicted MPP superfamily phosphohydrolase
MINKNKLLIITLSLVALSISATFVIYNISKPNLPEISKPEPSLDIAFYGDSRSNPEVHRQVVAQIIKTKPDMVFHLGDFVDDSNSETEWQLVKSIVTPLQEQSKFYSIPGNHELESEIYYRYFSKDAQVKWSSVDQGGAHIVLLNSNLPLNKSSEQYRWLENDLMAAGDNSFKVVILHHALLSVGNHAFEALDFRSDLLELFGQQKVDLVVSGHEHNYERFLYGNTIYVTTGGGGAPLYDRAADNPNLQKFVKEYHYCQLSLSRSKVWLSAYNEKGEVIDSIDINNK